LIIVPAPTGRSPPEIGTTEKLMLVGRACLGAARPWSSPFGDSQTQNPFKGCHEDFEQPVSQAGQAVSSPASAGRDVAGLAGRILATASLFTCQRAFAAGVTPSAPIRPASAPAGFIRYENAAFY